MSLHAFLPLASQRPCGAPPRRRRSARGFPPLFSGYIWIAPGIASRPILALGSALFSLAHLL